MCSKFEHYQGYKWKIALPAPSLYGQFDNLDDIEQRLDIYTSFFRKYGKNLSEINEFYDKANAELNQLLNF